MASESTYRVKGETGEWEVVVGLEVHAQITATQSKLFSGAATAFGAEPNTQVSLVDAAMPGMLPVPNRECIRQAVRTGMAIEAKINKWSRFDRKNYFYADLPQGYQISQLYHPLVGEGALEVLVDEKDEGSAKTIGIERIHVEQDAGKLMHDQHATMSYVDLNRCGVALMEIVSRPDMRSPAEAGAYLRKLRSILRYVGSCDGNMEEGSMRADVNVSVRKPDGELGTRTETKNVNSVRFVMAVVEHEAKRQVELIESGGSVVQETRLFDPDKGVTRTLRTKEDAHDYRYFPDPDLLPLELDDAFLEECRSSLPELPAAKRKRYEALGITPYNASVLTADVETARWFDGLIEAGAEPKQSSNWVVAELFGALNRRGESIDQSPVSPKAAAELLGLVADGTISGTIAKQVFEIMLDSGEVAAAIVEKRGLKQTSDTGAIDAAVEKVLADNADKVTDYKGGKQQLFGFFVGQVMKAMAGKANPQMVNERLRAKLD
ncbi:MAG TPA: Asp-tRNA(Asn)/Glu-tRNA(Gln) amidotransferase subunit GatB [Sphingomicrobium sp.]|nr:Asp-tRNA(Asn)/Glu-tRNA(Gln) amidotransferase subunit GatB [Sphingomicrobium sp.]